jgi:hypothetical protein
MSRWLVTLIVVDAILLPIAVVLILVGLLWAGIAVIVVDGIVVAFLVVRGVGGDTARNAELSAGGVPGKSPTERSTPPTPEARIFED